MNEYLTKIYELAEKFGVSFLIAIIIFIIGKWAARRISNFISKLMSKRNVDETVAGFVSNLVYILLFVVVVLAALNRIGVETGSFVVILGAAGLAIAFALQGSLSNFAAGVLLIIFRPFKAGDVIEGGGAVGVVEKIEIFTTTLKTPDNKIIIIPNSKLSGDNIVNYSAKETRRVDFTFGIGYNDDLKKAKNLLTQIVSEDERVLSEPAPMVAVSELADSSVNFTVRVWVKSADYWGVHFDTIEKVKVIFDEQGISIPYPQQDVHVFGTN